MKRYSYTLLLAVITATELLSSGAALAQQPAKPQRVDTLRRELTVVSDAEVHLNAAKPLPSTYRFDKPKVTRLEPVPPRSTGDFTPPVILPAYPALSNMASWSPQSSQHGYLDLALGLEAIVRAQAGYTQLFGESSLVDLHVRHNSTSSNNNHFYKGLPSRLYAYRHLTDWDLNYEYRDSAYLQSVQFVGDYDQFNYYGLDERSRPLAQGERSPMDVKQDYEAVVLRHMRPGNVRHASLFGIASQKSFRLFLEHTGRGYSEIPAFFAKRRVDEWRIGGDFDILFSPKQNLAWGVAGSILYRETKRVPADIRKFLFFSWKSNLPILYINVTPKIHLNGWVGNAQWQLTTGVNLLPLSPLLKGSLRWRNHLEIFANVDGGVNIPSLHELAREDRYLHPDSLIRPEFKQITSEMGVRAQLPKGFSLSLSGGYERMQDAHFWQPSLFAEKADDSTPHFVAFIPMYDNYRAWFVSGRMGYALGSKLQTSLQWTERRYTLDKGGIAQGKPKRLVDFSLTYSPTVNLDFSAQASLREGILFVSPHDPSQTLGTAQRLARLSAAWRITSWLAVHGEFSAPFLLSSEYPLYYREPNYLTAVVGATLRF